MKRVFLLFAIGVILFLAFKFINTQESSKTRDIHKTYKLSDIAEKKEFGNYYAMLIYVQEYSNLSPLKTPKEDVEEIAKILKTRYGFKINIVANPTNSDDLIKKFDECRAKLSEDDNLLIYYAGHGNKNGFWQLKDAKKNSDIGSISIEFVLNKQVKRMPAKHILVVADSCYSGSAVRADEDDEVLPKNTKHFYSKLNSYTSRNVLTSGADQPVLDQDEMNPKHSVFANGFIKMLKENRKKVFALSEHYNRVKKYVLQNTKKQTPLYEVISETGHELGGDFIFVDNFNLKKKSEDNKISLNLKSSNRAQENNEEKLQSNPSKHDNEIDFFHEKDEKDQYKLKNSDIIVEEKSTQKPYEEIDFFNRSGTKSQYNNFNIKQESQFKPYEEINFFNNK